MQPLPSSQGQVLELPLIRRREKSALARDLLLSATSSLLPIVGLLVAWETIDRLGFANSVLLSPPTVVFPAIWDYFTSGQIWPHMSASLSRGITGFAIALGIGVLVGLVMGWTRPIGRVIGPVVEVLRQLPPLAMFPVFLLFLGLGFKAQVAMVTWAATWPILLNTISGARDVDPRLVKAAKTLGANRVELFYKVALPAALPTIVTGLRLGASYALLVLVSAEMIGANSGLGFLILNNQLTFHIPQMYAAIIILACLGVMLNYGILSLESLLIPWRQRVS